MLKYLGVIWKPNDYRFKDWNLLYEKMEKRVSNWCRNVSSMDNGVKNLGFMLKANDYKFKDWNWLYEKMEKRASNWFYRSD